MGIKAITKEHFHGLGVEKNPIMDSVATEKAWFADDKENVLGAVILDRTDKDWNYVIVGRDERGSFRWIEGNSSFADRDDCEKELAAKLTELEASGKTVFPQGD